MRRLATLLLCGALLASGCSKVDFDCAEPDDPARIGDKLLGALRFDTVVPVRHCDRLPGRSSEDLPGRPPVVGVLPSAAGGTSDGTGVISPGSTVPFVAAWIGGPAQAVQLSFGGSTFLRIPIPGDEADRGVTALPAMVDPDFCAGLDAICHALMCCMQIVTPSGTYSAPVAQQMVLDCTGGTGCSPPYNTPPGSCGDDAEMWPEPVDLGAPEYDLSGCWPPCGGRTPYCGPDHRCVECRDDGDCPRGRICRNDDKFAGICLPGCNSDDDCQRDGGGDRLRCCGSECTDVTTNPLHCGACGMGCTVPNATPVCGGATCGLGACLAGWEDCDARADNGCETNLRIDVENCGGCGVVCMLPNASSGCANGCFITACLPGYEDCNKDVRDGCEARLDSDPMNCGACGSWCAFMNGAARCSQGKCAFGGCLGAFLDCDGNAKNGCEVNSLADPRNCGACGRSCPRGSSCSNGVCR